MTQGQSQSQFNVTTAAGDQRVFQVAETPLTNADDEVVAALVCLLDQTQIFVVDHRLPTTRARFNFNCSESVGAG